MNNIHMLCGLPRSGSTLLGNVLEQHPDIWVSGTSSLSACVQDVSRVISNSEEVKSELASDPANLERYRNSLLGLIRGRYSDIDKVVIDKGRLWTAMRPLVDEILPESKFIVCVRDPRDVIASVELQHRDTAIFMQEGDQTLIQYAESLMLKDSMVGGPIWHIEDLLRRQLTDNVIFVRYETFTLDPQTTMQRISDELKLNEFKWDFKNVTNRERDEDAIWRNKFPHKGEGEIKPSIGSWKDVMDEELASQILNVYPLYKATFGY